jgi:hypothetical protein
MLQVKILKSQPAIAAFSLLLQHQHAGAPQTQNAAGRNSEKSACYSINHPKFTRNLETARQQVSFLWNISYFQKN